MNEKKTVLSKKLTALLVVAVLVVGALVAYFFFIRVQDSEYDAANQHINTMLTKAAEFEKLAEDGSLNPATLDGLQLANAMQVTGAYTSAFAELQKSRAVSMDATLRAAFDENIEAVQNYGTSSTDMVTTVKAVASIKQSCNTFLDGLPETKKTVPEIQKANALCKSALEEFSSVPLKEFNENYFGIYRKSVSDLIKAIETYYAFDEEAESERRDAQQSIDIALYTIAAINGKESNVISNTANPSDGLRKLRDLVSQRKSNLLR